MSLSLPWSAGFETDAEGFTLDAGVSRSAAESHSGSYSLEFFTATGSELHADQTLDLGASATLKLWFKSTGNYGTFTIKWNGTTVYEAYGPLTGGSGVEWTTGVWTEAIATTTITGNHQLRLQTIDTYYTDYFYVDDISLTGSNGIVCGGLVGSGMINRGLINRGLIV